MKKMKLNQEGFSLVELMVVVAIIGILATIGIPQYQKFMAKARQSEAKSHLNAIFQGEASHYTEYNSYSSNMSVIGAAAAGQALRYNAGFGDNDVAGCAGASALTPAGTAANDSIMNTSPATTTWNFVINEPPAGATICGALGTAYTAMAWGNPTNVNGALPNNADNNLDRFTIDQNRLVTQTSVGM